MSVRSFTRHAYSRSWFGSCLQPVPRVSLAHNATHPCPNGGTFCGCAAGFSGLLCCVKRTRTNVPRSRASAGRHWMDPVPRRRLASPAPTGTNARQTGVAAPVRTRYRSRSTAPLPTHAATAAGTPVPARVSLLLLFILTWTCVALVFPLVQTFKIQIHIYKRKTGVMLARFAVKGRWPV